MPERRGTVRASDRECLGACLQEVSLARARLGAAHRDGVRSSVECSLRADLLSALEGFAAQIAVLGAPVPYRLRAEIELYRRLGSA